MLTKYLIAAVVALAAALGASGWLHLKQAEKLGKVELTAKQSSERIQALEKNAARYERILVQANAARQKEDDAHRRVQKAVEAAILSEPTWAATPVPKSILEAIGAVPEPSTDPTPDPQPDGLREPAPARREPDPASASAGAVSRAPANSADERGPAGLGAGSAPRAEEVQHR